MILTLDRLTIEIAVLYPCQVIMKCTRFKARTKLPLPYICKSDVGTTDFCCYLTIVRLYPLHLGSMREAIKKRWDYQNPVWQGHSCDGVSISDTGSIINEPFYVQSHHLRHGDEPELPCSLGVDKCCVRDFYLDTIGEPDIPCSLDVDKWCLRDFYLYTIWQQRRVFFHSCHDQSKRTEKGHLYKTETFTI
jgi:hypothetical protein